MKVFVGVDGSANSFAAVSFVGRLISPERDELMLFFAAPAMTFDDERLDLAVQERARTSLSRAVLDAALEKLPETWRNRAQQRENTGPPGPTVVDAAADFGADLVVVGFHGTSSIIEQYILGSVSRRVLQTAKSAVLVVKGKSGKSSAPKSESIRALVAHDTSDSPNGLSWMLNDLTWPPGSEGHVLTVVRPMFLAELPDWVKDHPRDPDVAAMADEWKKEHEQNLEVARTELDRFRQTLPPCFERHAPIVAEGRPGEQIITKARELGTDLIVLGSGQHGRIERLLIGSTSEQVLASAASSVLVVR